MAIIADLLARVRALLFRDRDEREMDEELRFHVAMEEDYRKRAGVSHAEAHREAMIALGGMERVKDEMRDERGTRLLEDFSADVRLALRTLRRNPGFALVAIATLAIGIGGTTAMFSAIDAVMLQPLPYRDPSRLVRIYNTDVRAPGDRGVLTPVHFVEYRQRLSSFEAVAAILTYSESGADIGTGNTVRRIKVLPTSAEYFDVVGVHPMIGATYGREDETAAPVVVLSHRLWEEQLDGKTSAIGGPLVMNGKSYRVAGVMPAGYEDPLVKNVDAWIPLDVRPGYDASNANNHYFTMIGRLRPGVSVAAAQSEITAVARALGVQYPRARDTRARIDPLKADIVGPSSRALEIMFGAVLLVMIVVCVNIATLMLVRASEREREFAVRAALGGEGSRLVRQMLVESLTLALLGDVAGLLVARAAMAGIVALGSDTIPRLATLTLDSRLLAFSIGISTLSALVFGAAPARRAVRARSSEALRGESRSATDGARQLRGREWLVVGQVALAFVLAVGAGLLLASLARLQKVDLGFKPANVLTFELHLPDARYDSTKRAAFYDDFSATIERLPGVLAAGGISKLPATGSFNSWGCEPTTGPLKGTRIDGSTEQRIVNGDYFRAAGIPLIAGRAFDANDDVAAPSRVVISASAAKKLFGSSNAIGQRLDTGGREWEVVGIVGDVALNNEGFTLPVVYHAHRQFAGDRNWALTQIVSTKPGVEVLAPIRTAISAADPQLVLFHPVMLEDVIGRSAAQRVFTLRILVTFAGVAILLAALGLFGVLSYGVRLRTRELGIRMALGAQASMIRRMVLGQGLKLTAIGLVFGVATAAGVSRLMTSLLFGVKPMDFGVLGAAIGIMAAVGAAAAYAPARRATAVDPRESLS